MRNWKRMSFFIEILIILLLLILFVISSDRLSKILIMISVILMFSHLYAIKKQSANEKNQSITSTLNFIHHYQHDLMNELQLIFGYLKLKKFDKLVHIVEKLKENMTHERDIVKLNSPQLEYALLQMKMSSKKFQLHVEQNLYSPDLYTNKLNDHAELLIDLIQVFENNSEISEGFNHSLTIDFFEEQKKLHVAFEFAGKVKLSKFKNELNPILIKFKSKNFKMKQELEEKWVTIEIEFD
ncbi:Spo0B domain-containing protein [Chengkuizengella axinellae]|uniref:Spo0B domain-containing protein n=1 Tax=Chengkuizengella axinellae TaxID=3064388 RepID=A0ABT9ITR1_9BACL|nr:Spo0B domain-containing protein [Chengkuizengella sp. 2205SS18-9]MDP5272739.1 Spo0B domain-containing protein [Chengkuizengella sp. 2205SS18-9]